jgi:hypothetical protein
MNAKEFYWLELQNYNPSRFADEDIAIDMMEKYVQYRMEEQRKGIQALQNHLISGEEQALKDFYEWLYSEEREPAQTKFTAGFYRNVAKEIEFREAQLIEKIREALPDEKEEEFRVNRNIYEEGLAEGWNNYLDQVIENLKQKGIEI